MNENQLFVMLLSWILLYFSGCHCRPQGNLIITTEQTSSNEAKTAINGPEPPPKIVEMDIRSDIQYRYAKTVVKSYVKNPSTSTSQDVTFNMVLPNSSFI